MNWIAFLSYVIIANISPGPNAIVSMSNATRFSLKKSLSFNVGVMIGVFIVLLLCCLLSATVLKVIPTIQSFMSWIGACYILYLAYSTLKSKPINEIQEDSQTNLFIHGIILQFLNPHTILYGLFAFSTFVLPHHQETIFLMTITGFLAIIALLTTSCWTLFGSLFKKILYKYYHIIYIIMSLLLVYCAITLII